MKTFAIDVPAYVTLRVLARDEAHALEQVRAGGMMIHEFGDDCQEVEIEGMTISPGITIYTGGITKPNQVQVVAYEDSDGESHCDRCFEVYGEYTPDYDDEPATAEATS